MFCTFIVIDVGQMMVAICMQAVLMLDMA